MQCTQHDHRVKHYTVEHDAMLCHNPMQQSTVDCNKMQWWSMIQCNMLVCNDAVQWGKMQCIGSQGSTTQCDYSSIAQCVAAALPLSSTKNDDCSFPHCLLVTTFYAGWALVKGGKYWESRLGKVGFFIRVPM